MSALGSAVPPARRAAARCRAGVITDADGSMRRLFFSMATSSGEDRL
jgi:hypothetical protein